MLAAQLMTSCSSVESALGWREGADDAGHDGMESKPISSGDNDLVPHFGALRKSSPPIDIPLTW
jgi:hypothetical protein